MQIKVLMSTFQPVIMNLDTFAEKNTLAHIEKRVGSRTPIENYVD